MSNFFSPDNPVMEFIAKIFDLVVLNLIFIFSCVPIVTIGASTSALSYVTLKMVRGEDPYIWKNFWKSFRQNFKQGTSFPFWSLSSLEWTFTLLIRRIRHFLQLYASFFGSYVPLRYPYSYMYFLSFHILCVRQSRRLRMHC